MFVISNALKNIRRHLRKSVLYLFICAVAALTLQIYMAGIEKTETQLFNLPDAIPISATVASLDGSRFDGLQIKPVTVDGLRSSAYVRNLKMTLILQAGIGEYSPERAGKHIIWGVAGVNSFEALQGLDPATVTWLAGYDSDFLTGDEMYCLADKSFMENLGLQLGDSIPLDLYYYSYGNRGEITYDPLGLTETRIVGITALTAVKNSPHIVIPFDAGRNLFSAQEAPFHAASATFSVADSLELNSFKTEMKAIQLTDVSTSGGASISVMSNIGTALVVNDATFISSATRLQESLSLLKGFLPLLALVLAAIGYFVAYLMVQNRREEYAIFRLLGMNRGKSTGLYFAEMTLLTVCGSLVGVLVSFVFGVGSFRTGVLVFVLLSLCFILGGIIALLRLSRTNVMLALTQAD